MNKLGGAKQMKGVDPMGGMLKDTPDHGGGVMYQGSEGGSGSKPAAGNNGKSMMVDGPYGGKVKA